jgi:hypothetical protein
MSGNAGDAKSCSAVKPFSVRNVTMASFVGANTVQGPGCSSVSNTSGAATTAVTNVANRASSIATSTTVRIIPASVPGAGAGAGIGAGIGDAAAFESHVTDVGISCPRAQLIIIIIITHSVIIFTPLKNVVLRVVVIIIFPFVFLVVVVGSLNASKRRAMTKQTFVVTLPTQCLGIPIVASLSSFSRVSSLF